MNVLFQVTVIECVLRDKELQICNLFINCAISGDCNWYSRKVLLHFIMLKTGVLGRYHRA